MVTVPAFVWRGGFFSRALIIGAIYLVLLLIELFWWPTRQKLLLTNAAHAADIAAHILEKQGARRSDL